MPLPQIGRPLTRAPARFEHQRDIAYLEGPIISLWIANDATSYLFLWRDSDDDELINRWLAIPTTEREIALYEVGSVSLHWIVQRAITFFIADMDTSGEVLTWHSLTSEDLPESYLPHEQSYFDPRMRPAGANAGIQTILLSGEWTLDAIADYSKAYDQVFAAQQVLSEGALLDPKSTAPFSYRFNSGWIYHTFWQTILRTVFGRPSGPDTKVVYQSPGFVQIPVDEHSAQRVVRDVRDVEHDLELLRGEYKDIHKWVKYQKSEKFRQRVDALEESVMSPAMAQERLRRFCVMLGTISYDRIDSLTERNSLNTAEIILSYFRLLGLLAREEMNGRALLVSLEREVRPPVLDEETAYLVELALVEQRALRPGDPGDDDDDD